MGVQDKSASLPPATKVASTPADMKSTRATTASTSRISYTDLTHDDDDVIILGSKKKTATTPRKRRMDEEDATDTATKKKKTATPRKKKDEEQRLKQFRKQAPQLYLQKLSRALEQRYVTWAMNMSRELLTRLIGCSSSTAPVKAQRRSPKKSSRWQVRRGISIMLQLESCRIAIVRTIGRGISASILFMYVL